MNKQEFKTSIPELYEDAKYKYDKTRFDSMLSNEVRQFFSQSLKETLEDYREIFTELDYTLDIEPLKTTHFYAKVIRGENKVVKGEIYYPWASNDNTVERFIYKAYSTNGFNPNEKKDTLQLLNFEVSTKIEEFVQNFIKALIENYPIRS